MPLSRIFAQNASTVPTGDFFIQITEDQQEYPNEMSLISQRFWNINGELRICYSLYAQTSLPAPLASIKRLNR